MTGGPGTVNLELVGHVAELGLAGGPLNLVTGDLLRALNAALDKVSSKVEVRCLVVHGGSARAFCAGSDMNEFAAIAKDASERKILFEDMVVRKLARISVPTIAAIDGPALGGGLELALACDLRVCRRGTTLGLTESRVGGLAGNGAVRLARLIGPARAKQMLFTGEPVSAQTALAWGLVNEVIDTGSALDAARRLAATMATRGPLSNRLAKQLADAAHDVALDAALSMSTVAQQKIFDSDDLHEGVAAFFAKREARFAGR